MADSTLSNRPGAICRAQGSSTRLLLVQALGTVRFRAVPYPVADAFGAIDVLASALEPVGLDEASARILALRWRTEQARSRALPARDGSPVPGAPRRPVRAAMVLCAGLGLRLRPLTLRYPKPALPFFGGPLVRYSFAMLRKAGIERVVINTHHLPDVMARVARDEASALGLAIAISHEPLIQGTGGALREARRYLEGDPFLLVNGDVFMSLDLAGLVAAHQGSGALATMAVAPMPEGESFAAVEATKAGEVRRIAGHGPGGEGLRPWHFVGAHVIEPEVLAAIPASGPSDINHDVYPALVAAGRRVRVEPVAVGCWADMGTPRRYLQACEEVLSGLCDLSALGESNPLSSAAAAALRRGGIEARRYVDPSARVDAGARLERAQVGPGAEVGTGARLERAAVLPETRIAPGESLVEAIACGELRVPAS